MLSNVQRGYTHMRHNEIRVTVAKMMHYVCYDFEVEPTLQLLQGESLIHKSTSTDENARLDNKSNGLWGLRLDCFSFDVKIVNPLANSCPKDSVEEYKYRESLKCLKCEQRIIDAEKSKFSARVFVHGGRRTVHNAHY